MVKRRAVNARKECRNTFFVFRNYRFAVVSSVFIYMGDRLKSILYDFDRNFEREIFSVKIFFGRFFAGDNFLRFFTAVNGYAFFGKCLKKFGENTLCGFFVNKYRRPRVSKFSRLLRYPQPFSRPLFRLYRCDSSLYLFR